MVARTGTRIEEPPGLTADLVSHHFQPPDPRHEKSTEVKQVLVESYGKLATSKEAREKINFDPLKECRHCRNKNPRKLREGWEHV